jgi:transcriptional regulator with XRE-family HTH domain
MPIWVEQLVDLITKEKISTKLLAETLGTSSQYCSKLLAGESSPPSAGKILTLLNFLESSGFLNEEDALCFLNEIIKEKLGTSELILLNEYDTRVKRLLIQNEDFLLGFYRNYTNNLIVHPDTIKILQTLQIIDTNQHNLIIRFIDYLLNAPTKKTERLLDFLEE